MVAAAAITMVTYFIVISRIPRREMQWLKSCPPPPYQINDWNSITLRYLHFFGLVAQGIRDPSRLGEHIRRFPSFKYDRAVQWRK
jgi:hypothetical protein